jgi:hypothetical protein
MSFFDRQGVSENLLRIQGETKVDNSTSDSVIFEHNDDDTESTFNPDLDPDFEDDIAALRDFFFIPINKSNSTVFTMHRLVQFTVRAWLKAYGQLARWNEQFIMIVWQTFPTGNYENWTRCQSLFPHVKLAMSQRPE